MIYYNPIKQFLKNIFNFLSSLFTKKFLLMIIVILVILLLHLNVQAETINQDSYVYRTPILSNFDEQNNLYNLTGTFYSQNGRVDVDLDIPNDMFTGSFFIVYFPGSDNYNYMLVRMHDKRSFDSFYLNYRYRNNTWHLYYSLNSKANGISNFDTLKYDNENKTWVYDLNNASGDWYWDSTYPCNIVYQKSCTVYYTYQYINPIYSASQIINYTLFKTPDLYYITNAFRLDLNGFGFYGQQFNDRFNDEYTTHKYQLEHLYISLYDINNKQYIFNNTDIISTINVTTSGNDEVSGYPIQSTVLDFNTYFNVLTNTTVNADYLIFISPVLKDSYFYNEIPLNMAQFYENFNDVSYWRYQYNASTGVGSLVPTDSEGNPLNPEPDDDTNNEEINNNLNNINNSIQDINDNLFNTEADDITLDDFGVSSPTIEGSPDLTNIFDLIYNSFMSVYEDEIYRIQFGLPDGTSSYNFDIPSDALSSKIPNELKILISVFWWVVLGGAVISFIVRIIHQVVTYSNGSVDSSGGSSGGGFLSELTMTPTEFVLFNILH